jgi:hypothetical protein
MEPSQAKKSHHPDRDATEPGSFAVASSTASIGDPPHAMRIGGAVMRVRLGLMVLLLVVLAACVAGPNPEVGSAAEGEAAAGFLFGLWHGIIAPFTFVVSLFTDNVNLYEVHNNGNWYDLGFVLGAGILFGGGSRGARATRRAR